MSATTMSDVFEMEGISADEKLRLLKVAYQAPAPYRDEPRGPKGPKRKSASKEQRAFVWARDALICQYCGVFCDGDFRDSYATNKPTVDHVIPVSQGGENTILNMVTACRRCNGSKHNRTPDQWYAHICAKYDHDETRL